LCLFFYCKKSVVDGEAAADDDSHRLLIALMNTLHSSALGRMALCSQSLWSTSSLLRQSLCRTLHSASGNDLNVGSVRPYHSLMLGSFSIGGSRLLLLFITTAVSSV
jgi:hypothetical protein